MNQPGASPMTVHGQLLAPTSKVFYQQINLVTHVDPRNHGSPAGFLAGARLHR
jgi:hypothetical protein